MPFFVKDRVFFKVSPQHGVLHSGHDNKPSSHFIGHFKILELVGEVAYCLILPPKLANVHSVFHISMLHKYEPDPSLIFHWSDLTLEQDIFYEEQPVQILEAV